MKAIYHTGYFLNYASLWNSSKFLANKQDQKKGMKNIKHLK